MEQQLDIKPASVHKKNISLNKTMYKKTRHPKAYKIINTLQLALIKTGNNF